MADNAEKYTWLDQLDTAQLQEFLRADMESDEESEGRQEIVLHIVEILERRQKEAADGSWLDPETAWAEFQKYYNVPEGNGVSLYPCGAASEGRTAPRKPVRWYDSRWRTGLAAAGMTAILLLGGMVAVQAAGVDIFGVLANWTDQTFHFILDKGGEQANDRILPAPEYQEAYSAIQTALRENGIPENFAPTWLPPDYVMKADDPRTMINDDMCAVCTHFEKPNGQTINIRIRHFLNQRALELTTFEKDSNPVEIYTSGDKTFYLVSNMVVYSANWSDGTYLISIVADMEKEELKKIIDSIGEMEK